MRLKQLKPGFEMLTSDKARLIGHLMFDGCIYRSKHDYALRYEVKDMDLLFQFRKLIVSVYGLQPSLWLNKSGKTGEVIPAFMLRSKLAFDGISRYGPFTSRTWKVPASIFSSKRSIKIAFLQAFFDDEGSIIAAQKRIRGYSINLSGLKGIEYLLQEFGFDTLYSKGHGRDRNVYAIEIRDLIGFQSEIGFSCNRKKENLKNLLKTSKVYKRNSDLKTKSPPSSILYYTGSIG